MSLFTCSELAVFAMMAVPAMVSASPIATGTWYQFGFTDAGVAATGCAPADAAGPFCLSSSGTPTTFLGAPGWTFTAPIGGLFLTVVDAFTTTERFQVFENGVSLGTTSAPNPLGDCGDDPVLCLADANASKATFFIAAGTRSITITPTVSPDGLGSAFLILQASGGADIPEPASLSLVGSALLAVFFKSRHQKKG